MAAEFQEWMRCKAWLACYEHAQAHFTRQKLGPAVWRMYESLCIQLGWTPGGPKPLFFLVHDSDSRHSYMLHVAAPRGRATMKDRRSIPAGKPFSMPMHPKFNYIPAAPKVQDCIQSPVEMVFADVKKAWDEQCMTPRSMTPREMVEVVRECFKKRATPELVCKCFDHALKCLPAWYGLEKEWVEIDGVRYKCVHGNKMPAALKG